MIMYWYIFRIIVRAALFVHNVRATGIVVAVGISKHV